MHKQKQHRTPQCGKHDFVFTRSSHPVGGFQWYFFCSNRHKMAKKIESMILLSYLVIFLTNFWVYHFFKILMFFHSSGSFQWIQTDVFLCSGDPGTIPDWSCMDLGNFIFSWKFSFFWPKFWGPTFMKTHMYIETLVNLSVPRPQVIQYAKLF